MKLTFLGTRGYIDARTPRHYRHASMLIEHNNTRIMIDCGLDWEQKVWDINPNAIFLTHAHPDHAWGIRLGAPCPVYATAQTWTVLGDVAVQEKHSVVSRQPITLGSITLEAFSVVHSIRAPAVGYRITVGTRSIFYAPDLIVINKQHEALRDVCLYIGDGATLVRPMVRRHGDQLFGHTTIRAQLGWCQKEGVPRMVVTHCGSQIVEHDGRVVGANIRELAKERGVEVVVAYDGMHMIIE